VKLRKTAFPRVGSVRSGNSQCVQAKVGSQIRRFHVLAKACPPERPVDQERWGKSVGLADASRLHERMAIADAAITQTPASRLTQAKVAMHQGVHDAVFEPELVLRGPVPIDLGVQVVAV